MKIFLHTIHRDMRIAFRTPAMLLNPLFFFIITTSLFPLAISPEASVLQPIAVGVIWVLVILSVLLTLGTLFTHDFESGLLEQMVISGQSGIMIMLAKACTHFILTGAPIILLTPIFGMLLFINSSDLGVLLLSLLLTTPTLSLIGVIGASLTAGLKHSGLLLFLIILPLYIPLLIFASSTVYNANIGLDISGSIYFLATMLVLMLMLSPIVSQYALRSSLQ